MHQANNAKRGATLLETLIGVIIIGIVSFSLFRAYTTLIDVFSNIKIKNAATNLASEQMEVIKNMSYSVVGVVGGIPAGVIAPTQNFLRDGLQFTLQTTIRNIDDPFDGTLGGVPNDTAPADYKLVELSVFCTSCLASSTVTITGRVAPKSLESASTNGALFVQAIDANGAFVSGASVHVVNNQVSPTINVTDVTNSNGVLQLVDVPPSFQSYQITVSKSGYSSAQTYATSTGNPNPTSPHSTVAAQSVTQTTFAIDRVGQINFSSLNTTCNAVDNTSIQLSGSKLIGTAPVVLKFNQNYVFPVGGTLSVPNLEWDTYSGEVNNAGYDLAGSIPNLPLNLNPGVTQGVKLIFQPKNSAVILATILDNATRLPLSNATVTLSQGVTPLATLATGRGFLRQTSWAGGSGQTDFGNNTFYESQDGGIDDANPAGEIRLKLLATSTYAAAGSLISSTFDTGSASNFYNLTFNPGSQPIESGADSVRFQLASATTSTPLAWNFLGPDASAGSYYTLTSNNISATHNGDRYLKYKVYLQTASTTFTPTTSDVAASFASDCVPPGQVLFQGLTQNQTYTLDVIRAGYQTQTQNITLDAAAKEIIILLSP